MLVARRRAGCVAEPSSHIHFAELKIRSLCWFCQTLLSARVYIYLSIYIHAVHHTRIQVTWSSTVQTLQILYKQRLYIFSSFIPLRQKSGLFHEEK